MIWPLAERRKFTGQFQEKNEPTISAEK